jgi:hypothetical protein
MESSSSSNSNNNNSMMDRVPRRLWGALRHKLLHGVLDIGNKVIFNVQADQTDDNDEDTGCVQNELSGCVAVRLRELTLFMCIHRNSAELTVCCSEDTEPFEDIYIIDHM